MPGTTRERLLAKARRRLRRAPRRRPEPVFPDVVEERTNIGPQMDALVTRVKRNQRPLGVDQDYDLLRENFDHLNFLLQNETVRELPNLDPISIFLRNGADAVSSPNHNFSMSNYLERYPEKGDGPERSPYLEWIRRGRAAGEIADPAQGIEHMAEVLGLEPRQVVDELVATRTDMMERLRTGTLGEMFAKAAEVEPLIGAVWGETTRTRMIPLAGKFVAGQVAAIHACQKMAGFRRARLVVVTDRPRWSSGRPFEGHLAHTLAGTIAPDDIVLVYTDESGTSPPRHFPTGVREIDFAAVAEDLPDDHQQQALLSLLRSLHADAIVNIDSALLYRLLAPYGKALAASERIFLCFLGNEQRPQGNWAGWSLEWFYAGFDLVAGFITDSEYLRDQLTEMYQLNEDDRWRMHVLRTPVRPELAAAIPAKPEGSRRPAVFWAGGGSRQTRPDIALEIARRMPDVDFRIFGEVVLRGQPGGRVPANVRLDGAFGQISDLDLSHADAWLYTSGWEGVPALLLEVAMSEVPIVGSLVGGVGEVLSDEDSWPVTDWEDPEAYEKALREILADPSAARRRSHTLRQRLVRDRPQRAYGEDAAALLLARTDASEGTR